MTHNPTMEELINKIQLSPKIMPASSRRPDGSSPESYSLHHAAVILLPRTMFAIITGINHTIQNCKGELIIKEPIPIKITTISKKHKQNIMSLHNIHYSTLTSNNYSSSTFKNFSSSIFNNYSSSIHGSNQDCIE